MENIISYVLPLTSIIALGIAVFQTNKNNSDKISRVYKRIDDVKDGIKKDYVQEKVCNALHRSLKDDISEIKTDVKLILRKNGYK